MDMGEVIKYVGLNLPTSIPLCVVAVWQMGAERQSDRKVSCMEVYIKQRKKKILLSEKNGTH